MRSVDTFGLAARVEQVINAALSAERAVLKRNREEPYRSAGVFRRASALIQDAVAAIGTTDQDIVPQILERLLTSRVDPEYRKGVGGLLEQRGIDRLMHFTRIENLECIAAYGLIPRLWLERRPIVHVLRPIFADHQRLDRRRDCNCVSVSFPTYRMLYRRSDGQNEIEKWAVLVVDAKALLQHEAEFAEGNCADPAIFPKKGPHAFCAMFKNQKIREERRLPPPYPTNPDAEVLIPKILSSEMIRQVHLCPKDGVDHGPLKRRLENQGLEVVISRELFLSRFDYKYWQSKRTAGDF